MTDSLEVQPSSTEEGVSSSTTTTCYRPVTSVRGHGGKRNEEIEDFLPAISLEHGFMAVFGVTLESLRYVLNKEKTRDLSYFQPHARILQEMNREKVWIVTWLAEDLSDKFGEKINKNTIRRISRRLLKYKLIKKLEIDNFLSHRTHPVIVYHTLDAKNEDIESYLEQYRAEDRIRFHEDQMKKKAKRTDPEELKEHLKQTQIAAKQASLEAYEEFLEKEKEAREPATKVMNRLNVLSQLEHVCDKLRELQTLIQRHSSKTAKPPQYPLWVKTFDSHKKKLSELLDKLPRSESDSVLQNLKKEGVLE